MFQNTVNLREFCFKLSITNNSNLTNALDTITNSFYSFLTLRKQNLTKSTTNGSSVLNRILKSLADVSQLQSIETNYLESLFGIVDGFFEQNMEFFSEYNTNQNKNLGKR
jgi:hypothetical protein